MASAGSVFTCGHLSPLVLPNTLANEAGFFHCHRLLRWLSLYYFIHYLLSSRERVSIIICLVCECKCFPFINYIKFLSSYKRRKVKLRKSHVEIKWCIHMNRFGFIKLWYWVICLCCNCLLLDVILMLQPTNKDFLHAFPIQLFV